MKTICLYFEIHQIIHLKRYRFFDIGTDHYYYDVSLISVPIIITMMTTRTSVASLTLQSAAICLH